MRNATRRAIDKNAKFICETLFTDENSFPFDESLSEFLAILRDRPLRWSFKARQVLRRIKEAAAVLEHMIDPEWVAGFLVEFPEEER